MSQEMSETADVGRSDAGVYRGTKEVDSIIQVRGVSKVYWRGADKVAVLEDLDLNIPNGAFEALMGPSGSGKTTLLNLIAGLDVPSSGSVRVADSEISRMNEAERTKWRSRSIGFVFQTYNLLPVLSALQNVEMPLLLTNLGAAERRKRAETALKVVGLAERSHHKPSELSGGQAQRVTIARAIVNDPKIIVADEPTGDLDRESANEILNLLEKLNKEFKKTIIMVTHDPAAAERASITRHLDKGRLR